MSSASSSTSYAAYYATFFVLTCPSDLFILGPRHGEALGTCIRMTSTLITVSLTSSWYNAAKIKRQLLFFSHWMSCLAHQLVDLIMSIMVVVCWSTSAAVPVIKTLKFIEQASTNMMAMTNLGICVNLALIVHSHLTMSRVQSVSTPKVVLGFAIFSVVITAAVVPFWETLAVSRTLYWPMNNNEASLDWIVMGTAFLEFDVGVCMLFIVGVVLLFRMSAVKKSLQQHQRFHHYLRLTVVAIVFNLVIGVGALLFVINGWTKWDMLVTSWTLRHIHIALDSLIVYGTLDIPLKRLDERGGERAGSTPFRRVKNKAYRVCPEDGDL